MIIWDAIKISFLGTMIVFFVLGILNGFVKIESVIVKWLLKPIKPRDLGTKQVSNELHMDCKKNEISNTEETERYWFHIKDQSYKIEVKKLQE